MKLFLGLIFLVNIANAEYAQVNSCKLTIGGRCFTAAEVTRFESGTTGVTLFGQVATSGRFSGLYDSTGAVYVVPGGKTLRIVAGVYTQNSSTITGGLQFGKCDDAATYDDTACTNVAYQMGAASMSMKFAYSPSNDAKSNEFYIGSGYTVATGKYPIVAAYGVLMGVIAYGFLE